MQYGVNPFKDEGCTTCIHFDHASARCNEPKSHKNGQMGTYKGYGLSPCGEWQKGFEFIPNSWGQFKRIDQ